MTSLPGSLAVGVSGTAYAGMPLFSAVGIGGPVCSMAMSIRQPAAQKF